MVIDSHRHWYPLQRTVSTRIASAMEAFFEQDGGAQDGAARDGAPSTWGDPGGTRLLEAMDRDGVDVSCLLVAGFQFDETDLVERFRFMNEATIELAEAHPERLRVYVGVHPAMRPTAALLQTLLASPVVAGVKMDPLAGRFDPGDEALDPVYRHCSDSGHRVLFHLGPRPDGVEPGAHPKAVSALLQRFPNLHVIGAHAAFEWWREMCEVAPRHPSLTCDISGLQYAASLAPDKVAHILGRVVEAFGVERVLFGTDSPTFDSQASVAGWLSFLRALPERHPSAGLGDDAVASIVSNPFAIVKTTLV